MLKWICISILDTNQNMITRKLREILNPYLIWQSRVNLNAALPESCRFYTRIPLRICVGHEINYLRTLYQHKVDRFHNARTTQEKCQEMYGLFSTYKDPRRLLLLTYSGQFKNINIGRLLYFSDKKHLLSHGVEPKMVTRLHVLCRDILLRVMSLKQSKLPRGKPCVIQFE